MPTKTAPKTMTKATSSRKTSTSRKAPAKPASKTTSKTTTAKAAERPATPAVSVVKDAQTTVGASELKKRELLDLVVQRSDVKKKFAKPVVEAMVEILGEALAEERPLNLQPMGRVLPQRTKDAGKNRVIIARIRQSKERVEEAAANQAANQAVADAAE